MKHVRTLSKPAKAATGPLISLVRQLIFILSKGQSWTL